MCTLLKSEPRERDSQGNDRVAGAKEGRKTISPTSCSPFHQSQRCGSTHQSLHVEKEKQGFNVFLGSSGFH